MSDYFETSGYVYLALNKHVGKKLKKSKFLFIWPLNAGSKMLPPWCALDTEMLAFEGDTFIYPLNKSAFLWIIHKFLI